MSYAQIIGLIISIATSVNVPPHFALSIALTENPGLNPTEIHVNQNGTVDRGIFQLNSSWYKDDNWKDPESNIKAGCLHIKQIMESPSAYTYWDVAIIFNSGHMRLNNPPAQTIEYATKVMSTWLEIGNGYVDPIIRK